MITLIIQSLFGMGATAAIAIIADSAIRGFILHERNKRELGE